MRRWRTRLQGLLRVAGALAVLTLAVTGLAAAPTTAAAAAVPGAAGDGTVSPSSGAYAASIDIDLPDYHDLEPDLALAYNSGGDDGFAGVGWDLRGESLVERASPGGGVPVYGAGDIFLLDGAELIPCTALGGTHCTRHQSYQRIRQDAAANAWYVWEPDGTKKTYTPLYCVASCSAPAFDQIFRWALRTEQDPNGNTVTYGYWCDPGQNCYLDTIAYGTTTVRLWREARPEDISFANGSYVGHTNFRLRSIQVDVGGRHRNAYGLAYATGPDSRRSILTGVRRYGTDVVIDGAGAITGGTALPAQAMAYGAGGTGFANRSWNASLGGWNASWRYLFGDVDDDGRTDQVTVWQHPDGSAWAQVRRSDGSGFSDASFNATVGGWNAAWGDSLADVNGDGRADLVRMWQHPNGLAYALVYPSNGSGYPTPSFNGAVGGWDPATVRDSFADVNGDGRADLVRVYKNGINVYVLVYPSDGSGFPAASFNGPFGDWNDAWKYYFADVNGDGRADLVTIWQGPDGSAWAQVNLSDGSGYPTQIWNGPVGGWNPKVLTDNLADVNGDGKADLVRVYKSGSDANIQVTLSNGRGFTSTSWNGPIGGWNDAWKQSFVDVDGDGRTDVVTIWQNPDGTAWAQINLFDGTGYGTRTWNATVGGWDPATVRDSFVDVNGDGKSDLVRVWRNDTSAFAQVTPSQGGTAPPDLLASMTNGQGGTTTLAYQPSSAWPGSAHPRGGTFPTVSTITVTDGRGVSGQTKYSYADPRFSPADKAFFGFRYQKAVVDAQGTYTETYSRQTVNGVGQVDATYTRNGAGALFAYTTNAYAEAGDGRATPYSSLVAQSSDFECNLTSTCRETRSAFTYDAYGNHTQVVDYGDAALSGDERTKTYAYAYNTSAYLVSLPWSEASYRGTSAAADSKFDETRTYYDGAADLSAAPVRGNVTRTDRWDGATGGYVTAGQTTYDAYGNATDVTDAHGATTTTTYDPTAHLFPTQTCNALNQCTKRTWDPVLGAATDVTDENGAIARTAYDAVGRKTGETDAAGHTTTWQYVGTGDPASQHVHEVKPDGSADGLWTDTYADGLGRVYQVVREGAASGTTYVRETRYGDGSTRPVKVSQWHLSSQAPVWETYTYDGAGRQTKVTHADGTASTLTYTNDAAGKPYTAAVDELGHEHASWTDAADHVIQVREKNGTAFAYTTYAYDAAGNPVRSQDAAGRASTATYDSLGHRTSVADADMGTRTYGYDAGGLLTSLTDAMGQTITSTYDPLGRVRTRTAGGQTTTWNYDEAGHGASVGQLTSVAYPGGGESHTWDALGHETATTLTVGTTAKTFQTAYDALGRVRTLTYPDAEVVTYGYAPDGQLATVSGYVNGMTWSPGGQLTQVLYANGTTTSYAYDPNRLWLTSASVAKGTTTLYGATYAYNAGGLVTSETQGSPTPRTVTYGYDDLNRLTTVGGAQSQTFAYDAVGNMTSNSAVGSYTYGDAAHEHAVTAAGSATYTYDANGNMRSGDGRTLAWDAQNRLASATRNGSTTSFAYGAGEERVRKTQGAHTTLYFGTLLEVADGSPVQYYYAGPLLVAKKDAAGTRTWYHSDRLGSVRLMTSSAGQAVNSYDYTPFGEQQASMVTVPNPRGFTGQLQDAETGLTYMVARYLDPKLGRFLSADTEVGEPFDPQELNRYSYTDNDPVNSTDPTGHRSVFAGWRQVITWTRVAVYRVIEWSIPYVIVYPTYQFYWKRVSVTISLRIGFIHISRTITIHVPAIRVVWHVRIGFWHFRRVVRFTIAVPHVHFEAMFRHVADVVHRAARVARNAVKAVRSAIGHVAHAAAQRPVTGGGRGASAPRHLAASPPQYWYVQDGPGTVVKSTDWTTQLLIPVPIGCRGYLCSDGIDWAYTGFQARTTTYEVHATRYVDANGIFETAEVTGRLTKTYTRDIYGVGQITDTGANNAQAHGRSSLISQVFCETSSGPIREINGPIITGSQAPWTLHC
jgi:RHS repeat-associated protein